MIIKLKSSLIAMVMTAGLLAFANVSQAETCFLKYCFDGEEEVVWNRVVGAHNAAMRSDAKAYMSYFAEDYVGWVFAEETPTTKGPLKRVQEWLMEGAEPIEDHTIIPAYIRVNGTRAYVYYTSAWEILFDNSDEVDWHFAVFFEIWAKEDGKWMLKADHGGRPREF